MKTLRVVIVDDEPLGRRGVRQLLSAHEDVEIVAEARNGREAVALVRSLEPDVVFLDVQMPGIDGFEVLRRLNGCQLPWIIFVTAHDAFAVQAFEVHALDYLVKPLHEDRFHAALARARERLNSDEAVRLAKRLGSLLENRADQPNGHDKAAPRLIIPDRHGDTIVEANDIDWIEAYDYYAAIHIKGRRILTRDSMDVLETRLSPGSFVRVHRSAIVNLAKVRAIHVERARATVLLANGDRVPISRRRRRTVASAIRRFAGKVKQ